MYTDTSDVSVYASVHCIQPVYICLVHAKTDHTDPGISLSLKSTCFTKGELSQFSFNAKLCPLPLSACCNRRGLSAIPSSVVNPILANLSSYLMSPLSHGSISIGISGDSRELDLI